MRVTVGRGLILEPLFQGSQRESPISVLSLPLLLDSALPGNTGLSRVGTGGPGLQQSCAVQTLLAGMPLGLTGLPLPFHAVGVMLPASWVTLGAPREPQELVAVVLKVG